MKQNVALTIASLLSILLMTAHMTEDVLRGFETVGASLVAVPILVIWLYGTLVLAGRRSGYVIILLGSLVATLAPILHLRATGSVASGEIAKTSGAFFFVWTLFALGVTALFSVVLSVLELWRLGRVQAR